MTDLDIYEPPRRDEPRPLTSDRAPHIQHDQIPPSSFVQVLLRGISDLLGVGQRESRMARTGAVAFWIPDQQACGPVEAFIDDHEFCHVHSEGTLHLTAPAPLRSLLIEKGWAEPHIMAKAGLIQETLLLVYAPRNDSELRVVLWIVKKSAAFAMGITWQ